MDDQSSISVPSSTYDPYRIPLFTYVTRTSSTSYTTDIRLFFAITVLTSVLVYARGFGWEFLLLLLAGGGGSVEDCETERGYGVQEGEEGSQGVIEDAQSSLKRELVKL